MTVEKSYANLAAELNFLQPVVTTTQAQRGRRSLERWGEAGRRSPAADAEGRGPPRWAPPFDRGRPDDGRPREGRLGRGPECCRPRTEKSVSGGTASLGGKA